MKKRGKMKTRWISMLLSMSMLLSSVPVTAFAEGETGTVTETEICMEHHPEHTAECGYAAAVEGQVCGHVCTEECQQMIVECVHVHGENECTFVEAQGDVPVSGECNHVDACTEESGCVTSVNSCAHTEHDEACGYIEAKEAVPCSYAAGCPQCEAEKVAEEQAAAEKAAAEQKAAEEKAAAEKAAAEQKAAEEKAAAEKAAAEQKAAEEKAAADAAKVAEVQALVDALPDTVTLDNKEETGNQLNAVIAAYGNLEEALQVQVDLTKCDTVIAAMYELEGMAGAQEPQVLADSYLRVYDRVVGGDDGYVGGLIFNATNDNGEVKEIKNGDPLESMGFSAGKTYSCTLVRNETGKNYEVSDSFTIHRNGSSGDANLYVYRQYDLTVKVEDSLGNVIANTPVSLTLPDPTRRGTTNNSGEVIFDKINGLYTVNASVSYTKENGEIGTITSRDVYMGNGDQTVELTIPRETKVTVNVAGYYDGMLIDNDVSNATVTVKNSRNESVTLTRSSDGSYTGLVRRTSNGNDTFTVSVDANGYNNSTTTVSSSGGSAISTTVNLNMKNYQVNGIPNNREMSTGTKYNVSITPTDIPEDWVPKFWDEKDGFDVTEGNGTWTIVPKKSGTYTLQFVFEGSVNSQPVVMVLEEFQISVSKGTVEYPAAPSLASGDTDVTVETFTLPADLRVAQKLTIKATDKDTGTTLNEETYTDLTAGGTVSMKLKDSVVQGNIQYTYTYFSDEVTYSGSAPTNTKSYYKEISDITVGSTSLVYNGQAQHPAVNGSGKYIVKTGYYWLEMDNFFNECQTSVPTENYSYRFDIGIGTPSDQYISTYIMKIIGDETKFYKGEITVSYTIEKRPITLTVKDQNITYGSAIVSGADAVTISENGLVSNHTLNLAATPSTSNPTQDGTIAIDNVKIMAGAEDVTKHYTVNIINEAKLTISKIPMNRISVEVPESVVYTGTEQTPVVVKLDETVLTAGKDYTSTYKNNKEVGTAEVTVSSVGWETESITKSFEIKKKSLTASIQNANEEYDGTAAAENASVVLTGICSSDDVSVNNENLIISYQDANVGTDKIVTAENIELTGAAAGNYQLVDANGELISNITGTGTISKRPVKVTVDSLKKTYGQNDPELTWKHDGKVVEGEALIGINISRIAGEDAGNYEITVSQNEGANSNYGITFVLGTFTIEKKDLHVVLSDLDKQYDGLDTATFAAELDGIERNDTVILNSEGVTARFESVNVEDGINISLTGEFEIDEASQKNYTLIQPTDITANIYNTYDASEYMFTPSDWTNEVVTITAAEGYEISLENKDDSNWTDSLSYSAETALEGQEVTFYLRNVSTKAISLPEKVTYYIDTTDPVGAIAIRELQSWDKLLDTITFGLFFNKIQTVEITADDILSGIRSIEYFESDRAYTEEELKQVTEWKEYNGSFHVSIEDAKKFVYFAKITDHAGNVIYLSTDGAIYDTSAPAVEGVVNGGKYTTTQTVTVTDANLETLMLDGVDVTSPFVLEGNKDAIYMITATDKAGNSTTVSVVMQLVAVLDDTIEQMEPSTVTSDEKETIQSVLDQVDELLKDEDTAETEKAGLEEIKKEAEALKDAIKKAEAAVSTEEIKKVEDLDNSNVKPEDKSDIQAAKDALEQALKDNAGNYTEAEKSEIQQAISRLEGAAASIEKAEAVMNDIQTLPKSADTDMAEEKEEAILAVWEAYHALSEHERAMISEKDRTKLETLMEELTAYEIIKGDGSSWTKGSDKTLTFVANGAYRKYMSVGVDGKQIMDGGYTVEEGSTVVKLKPSYLETLSEGEYTITIQYTDGEAEGTFTVKSAAAEVTAETQEGAPATGDETNLVLWSVLMGMSVLGMAVLLFGRRRRSVK